MTSAGDWGALRLLDWNPQPRGALTGKACVEQDGHVVSDIAVFAREVRRCTPLPTERQQDRAGQIVKDRRSSKKKYRSHLKWRDHTTQGALSHAPLSAIEQHYGRLDGAGA